MRIKIYSIFIFLLSGIYVNAHFQEEVFPTSNALWNVHRIVNGYFQQELIYGLLGDTIIENKTYSKYYLLNDTTLTIDPENIYQGCIRVDGKQVWFRPATNPYLSIPSGKEFLLYDYSKDSGDNYACGNLPMLRPNSGPFQWGASEYNWTCKIISKSIHSKTNRNVYLVEYKTEQDSNGYSDEWIEGIGSLRGLMWAFRGIYTDGWSRNYELACFKHNDEVKYINNDICNTCFCKKSEGGVGISDKIDVPLEIVSGNNNIQIRGESSIFPCELKLFSSTGQLVLKKILLSDKNEVSVRQKGICIYQIQKDGEIVKL